MAWCPNCGDGFRDDLTRCGWCGAALRPGQRPDPALTAPDPGVLVPLCRLQSNTQIALITSILRGADIPFAARDEGSGEYLRILTGGNAFGQCICVPAAFYVQARDVLTAYYAARPDAMIFEDDPEAVEAARLADQLPDPPAPDDTAGSAFPPEEMWKALPAFLLAFAALVALLSMITGRPIFPTW